MSEQLVELLPGESELVSFEAIPSVAKTYQVSVDGLTGSFLASPVVIPPMVEVVLPITWEDDGHSFATRAVKTARVTIVNPRSTARDYVATLYLGTPQVATSGPQSFTLPALSYADVHFTLTMPSQEGVYRVYLPIFSEGNLIEVFDTGEDVNIYYVAPPEAVTIDSFKMRCAFAGSIIYTEITLTNHTNVTFIDQTPTGSHGGLIVQMWTDGFKYPGTSYDYYVGGFFKTREWDSFGIGNLPPGTHVISSAWYKGVGARGTFFEETGIGEGTRGLVEVLFRAANEVPTPMVILAEASRKFEGVFSSSWKEWAPTSWEPPVPDFPSF